MKYCFSAFLISVLLNCSSQKQSTSTVQSDPQVKQAQASGDTAYGTGVYAVVPKWYLQNRVQVLSRLLLKDIDNPAFWNMPKQMAAEGCGVFVRHIKAADEKPWWQSSIGSLNPLTAKLNANGHNLAVDMISQMHNAGMHAIFYYRHNEDEEMYQQHPDWACRTIADSVIEEKRGVPLCFNSPYRNVVITRLRELASYGADGFYFDWEHIPYYPDMLCFCTYCQAKYKQEYGVDIKQDYNTGNKLRFFEFRNNTIKNFFDDLQDSLHKDAKDPVLLVSGNSWPALTELHMNSETFNRFILKSELGLPGRTVNRGTFKMPQQIKDNIPGFYLNAFYYSFMRDNSAGPPNIWCPFIDNREDALTICAGVVSLGSIPAVDVDTKTPDLTIFSDVLQWNKKYGNHFAKLKPFAWQGIVVSEKERNKFVVTPAQAWQQVILPAYKTFKELYDAGIPVSLLDDASLTETRTASLKNIYCNMSLSNDVIKDKKVLAQCTDFNSLPTSKEKALAVSLSSPVFCLKKNPFTHFNYYKNDDGYIYALYAPDFTTNITVPKENLKANDAYTKTPAFTNEKTFLFYVKKENMPAGVLEDVINNTTIKPLREEDGYYVFKLDGNNAEKLGMVRFKSNL